MTSDAGRQCMYGKGGVAGARSEPRTARAYALSVAEVPHYTRA